MASFFELGYHIGQENLEQLVRQFLFYHQNPTFTGVPLVSTCPSVDLVEDISVFHSAKAVFCAPSNPSGIGGLYREVIRSTPRWKTSGIIAHRRDCVLLNTESDAEESKGPDIARVYLFFSFALDEDVFDCALIHHFCDSFTAPDPDTGMWVVEPDYDNDGYRIMSVVHVNSIIRAAHLLPVFKDDIATPRAITFAYTLDTFKAFYVNRYIDYHAFQTIP